MLNITKAVRSLREKRREPLAKIPAVGMESLEKEVSTRGWEKAAVETVLRYWVEFRSDLLKI